MAVAIRLARVGATKRPAYRVVAIDKRRSRDGRALEILGYYDPLTDPATVKLDTDKINAWIGKGALPSDTVSRLLKQAEAAARGEEPAPKRARTRKPSKKAQTKAAAAAEAAAAPVEAAPEATEVAPEPAVTAEPVAEVAEPVEAAAEAEEPIEAEAEPVEAAAEAVEPSAEAPADAVPTEEPADEAKKADA